MKTKKPIMLVYPPPPPPPPPLSSTPSKSHRLLVVAFLLIIVVVSAGVLVYLATGPSSTKPTPSPSATPAATPTATPPSSPGASPTATPTFTPSGNNPIANLRVGAYAIYRTTTFTSGSESVTSTLKMSVDREESYNGVPCWVMSMTTETPTEDGTSKTVVTWWMSKTTLEAVHIRMQMYMNNVLVFDEEYDPDEASTQTGEPPEPVDPNTIVSYETVTVPAGTFTNCAKAETHSGTSIVRTWVHKDVPLWGMVKTESYHQSELRMKMELIAYGG